MSSNHPWKTKSRYFHCPPDCPDRKPGCQDHCEKHAADKARYNADRASERKDRDVDGYVAIAISINKNSSAIRKKDFSGYSKNCNWD